MTDETKENTEPTDSTPQTKEVSKEFADRRNFMNKVGVAGAAALTASMATQAMGRPARAAAKTVDRQLSCTPEEPSALGQDKVTTEEMLARYQRAKKLEPAWRNRRAVALNASPVPHWCGDSDCCWYIRETRSGQQYRLVDAVKRTNLPAFDHQALANALTKGSGQPTDPENLPLSKVDIALSPRTIRFTAFDAKWEYDDETHQCRKLGRAENQAWVLSPDGKMGAFIRDHNLWIHDIKSGREWPLTHDGEELYEYGSAPTAEGRRERPAFDFLWSPDSKRLLTQLRDTRKVGLGIPLVQHVPPDGSLRPKIIESQRRVAVFGDEYVEAWTLLVIDVADGAMRFFDCPPQPVNYPHYGGFFPYNRGWWLNERYACCILQNLDKTNTRVMKLDSHTGKTSVLFSEDPHNAFEAIPIGSHRRAPAMFLPETNELIWWSDRSGWMHLYRYDALSGKLKGTITRGDWVVRNVLHYDAQRRELFIQTAGRVKGRNPYYRDVCRVSMDTGQLTTVLSTNHDHDVFDRYAVTGRDSSGVSPSGNYVMVTHSRRDDNPVTLLLDRDGRELMRLETADPYGMPDYKVPPEPVMLKAADGKTDIYALVIRPSDFSPEKSYPVIDFTRPPSAGATGSSSHFFFTAAAYAELGFIVVQVAGRGPGIGIRNKAFQVYSDPAVPECYGVCKKDNIAAIKQLADRYPYMDLRRVGVVDVASSAGALTGLLAYPEFYKVGVTINPLSDFQLMPVILHPGILRGSEEPLPDFKDLANNLQGKLLLIHGMMEEIAQVSATFRLVEALQKANKRFDMLLLPNGRHIKSGYMTQAGWDYMVTHLLHAEPPEDFHV